jgi:hypothetical protein
MVARSFDSSISPRKVNHVSDPRQTFDETHKAQDDEGESWNETEDIPPSYFEPQGDDTNHSSPPRPSSEDDTEQNTGDS